MNDTTKTTDLTIANEISAQIGGQAFMMMGTRRQAGDKNSLTFDIRGCRKYSHIKVTLTSMDLYEVEFIKVKKSGIVRDTFEMIYNDQLKGLIERETGLYLSL